MVHYETDLWPKLNFELSQNYVNVGYCNILPSLLILQTLPKYFADSSVGLKGGV